MADETRGAQGDAFDPPPVALSGRNLPVTPEHPIVVEDLTTAFGEHVIHQGLSLTVNRGTSTKPAGSYARNRGPGTLRLRT